MKLPVYAFLLLCACGTLSNASDASIDNTANVDVAVTDAAPPSSQSCPDAPSFDRGSVNAIGTGTRESCTEAALRTAAVAGGRYQFRCGSEAHTIVLSSPLVIAQNFALDGENLITLSGGGRTRIAQMLVSHDSATPELRFHRLRFVDGFSQGDGRDPNQGGGAIMRLGGSLLITSCRFENNRAPALGQDVAGGAVYSRGGGSTRIFDSVFQNNQASSGGAVGILTGNRLEIVRSVLQGSQATGTGGNPGNGGNGGAIYIDGAGTAVSLCAVRIRQSVANAYGGAVFRVAYQNERIDILDSVFDRNEVRAGHQSLGGGLYLQRGLVSIVRSSITRNQSWGGGGIFVAEIADLVVENTTIAANVARDSLGGGVTLESSRGVFRHVTLSENRAPSPVAFAGAIHGSMLRLVNTLIQNNVAGNGYNPISCTRVHENGGGNLQWPVLREGGSDAPGQLCAQGITIENAGTLTLADDDVPVAYPASTSIAARFAGANCAAVDQLGRPRPTPCASGALEPQ